MLSQKTVDALKEPLNYHGAGSYKKWQRFVKLVELEFQRQVFTDPDSQTILHKREQRMEHYGKLHGADAARLLVEDMLSSIKEACPTQQEQTNYFNLQMLPWLGLQRMNAAKAMRETNAANARIKHAAQVRKYQERRRDALANGVVPHSPEWQKLFKRGRAKVERERSPDGMRRWRRRRQTFYASSDANDAKLVELWEGIWGLAKQAGFKLP